MPGKNDPQYILEKEEKHYEKYVFELKTIPKLTRKLNDGIK